MGELSFDWPEIEKMLVLLSRKIRRTFVPDVVVGVARGGLIPAVRLCHLLGDREFRVIHMRHYRGKRRMRTPELISDIKPLKGKVLLVDDVADTGRSLRFVLDHVRKRCNGEVRVATLACKPRSDPKPDYFAFETEEWVIFPWEKRSRG